LDNDCDGRTDGADPDCNNWGSIRISKPTQRIGDADFRFVAVVPGTDRIVFAASVDPKERTRFFSSRKDGSDVKELAADLPQNMWISRCMCDEWVAAEAGRVLLYAYSYFPPEFRLYSSRIDGTGSSLLSIQNGWVEACKLTPDHHRVVFTMRSEYDKPANLYAVNLDGTNLIELYRSSTNEDVVGDYWGRNLVISEDSSYVVFPVQRRDTGRYDLFATNLSDSRTVLLTDETGPLEVPERGWIGYFRFTPDGQWVVFVANGRRDGPSELVASRLDGTDFKRLGEIETYLPSWALSPDSLRAAFVNTEEELVVVTMKDGDSTVLSGEQGAGYYQLRFCPDGQAIVFTNRNAQLEYVKLDGTDRVLISSDNEYVYGDYYGDYLAFTPDASKIVYMAAEWPGGRRSLYVNGIDGVGRISLSPALTEDEASYNPIMVENGNAVLVVIWNFSDNPRMDLWYSTLDGTRSNWLLPTLDEERWPRGVVFFGEESYTDGEVYLTVPRRDKEWYANATMDLLRVCLDGSHHEWIQPFERFDRSDVTDFIQAADASRLVYLVDNSDLFVAEPETGQVESISKTFGSDDTLVYWNMSQDGRWLVLGVISSNVFPAPVNLHTVDLESGSSLLLPGGPIYGRDWYIGGRGGPAVSRSFKIEPYGTRVFFVTESEEELWSVHFDGSGLERIGDAEEVVDFVFTPDGQSLLYLERKKPPAEIAMRYTLLRLDTNTSRDLSGWLPVHDSGLIGSLDLGESISPDSAWLIHPAMDENGLPIGHRLVSLANESESCISLHPEGLDYYCAHCYPFSVPIYKPHVAFKPNSSGIVYLAEENGGDGVVLLVEDLPCGVPRQVARLAFVHDVTIGFPSRPWSIGPNGSWVVLETLNEDSPNGYRLQSVSLDDGTSFWLNQSDDNPVDVYTLCPDESCIVYRTWADDGSRMVFYRESLDGQERALIDCGVDSTCGQPFFDPESGDLFFTAKRKGTGELELFRAGSTGSDPQRLHPPLGEGRSILRVAFGYKAGTFLVLSDAQERGIFALYEVHW
jgi:Tol biopolymer transport system component